MTGPLTAADADYWGRSVSDRARLALVALLVAPVTATAAWWMTAEVAMLEGDSAFLVLAIGLTLAAMTITAAYGRLRRAGAVRTAAAVLGCLIATPVVAFASWWIAWGLDCASGCG